MSASMNRFIATFLPETPADSGALRAPPAGRAVAASAHHFFAGLVPWLQSHHLAPPAHDGTPADAGDDEEMRRRRFERAAGNRYY